MAGHTYAQSSGPDKHTNKRVTVRQDSPFFLSYNILYMHLLLSLFFIL